MNDFKRPKNFPSGPGGPGGFPGGVQIDLSAIPLEKCLKCGGEVFTEKFLIKKLSAVQSPKGKDEVIRFQVFVCSTCNQALKLK